MIEDTAGSSKRVRGDHDLLVELEARGYTHAAVGRAAGVSERTVQRRAAEPVFAARVSQRRNELFSESIQRMVGLSEKAHAVVEEALDVIPIDGPPAVHTPTQAQRLCPLEIAPLDARKPTLFERLDCLGDFSPKLLELAFE